jgi:hypothetical protein
VLAPAWACRQWMAGGITGVSPCSPTPLPGLYMLSIKSALYLSAAACGVALLYANAHRRARADELIEANAVRALAREADSLRIATVVNAGGRASAREMIAVDSMLHHGPIHMEHGATHVWATDYLLGDADSVLNAGHAPDFGLPTATAILGRIALPSTPLQAARKSSLEARIALLRAPPPTPVPAARRRRGAI